MSLRKVPGETSHGGSSIHDPPLLKSLISIIRKNALLQIIFTSSRLFFDAEMTPSHHREGFRSDPELRMLHV
jgi:hypothetical protein